MMLVCEKSVYNEWVKSKKRQVVCMISHFHTTISWERYIEKIVLQVQMLAHEGSFADLFQLAAKELSHDDLDRFTCSGLDVVGTELAAIKEGLLLMRAKGICHFVIAFDSYVAPLWLESSLARDMELG
ncbi:hypothetical protein L3X38_012883 [Prunus dulcis]|uniref:Uncharacterized protein n=1 Tax=Prunus dulcis TaxID=3755 RepID=A0AAD4ZGT5_PRUDU|nr:hypothetical protein L3X38_012883 [Prunus dulcis]